MRAMTAASGQPQAPEHVDARPQRKKAAKAFGAARKRLVNALIGGAASAKPAMAARAEAMFEFWTQEQEENNQQDHIDRCRIQFFIALAQIEQKAVMKAPAKKKVMAKMSPVTFLVYFGLDNTTPDSSANSVIGTASEVIKDTKPKIVSIVSITGHTDRAGSGSYNSALAEKRANVVADALRKLGVSGRLMTIGALGENANAVETKDSMKEASNRRVEVSVRY